MENKKQDKMAVMPVKKTYALNGSAYDSVNGFAGCLQYR